MAGYSVDFKRTETASALYPAVFCLFQPYSEARYYFFAYDVKITAKLFAELTDYLPDEAENNSVQLQSDQALTIGEVIRKFNIPHAETDLVMVNGVHVIAEQYNQPLNNNDVISIWPAVSAG